MRCGLWTKKRIFALFYRLAALFVAISGLACGSGFTQGFRQLLFYTAQSNILAAVMLLVLCAYTLAAKNWNEQGRAAQALQAAEAAVMLMIMFTLAVFWLVLAPFAHGFRLLGYGNIVLHTVTPLLMLFDYVLFAQKGSLKLRHVLVCALLPLFYVIQAWVLGFCGVEFYVYEGVAHRFPYYFMDYDLVGAWAIVFVGLIAAVFCGCALIVYRLDKKILDKRP